MQLATVLLSPLVCISLHIYLRRQRMPWRFYARMRPAINVGTKKNRRALAGGDGFSIKKRA